MNQVQGICSRSGAGYRWKRRIKRYLLPVLVDALMVAVAFYTALSVRFVGDVPARFIEEFNPWMPVITLVYLAANYRWQIYNRYWRKVTSCDVVALIEAVGFATLLLAALDLLRSTDRPLPLGQILLGGLFSFLLMLMARCRYLLLEKTVFSRKQVSYSRSGQVKALIVGAGDHGRRLAQHLRDDPIQRDLFEVVGFVDDDEAKVGLRIDGMAVLGNRGDLPVLVKQRAVDQVIISSRTAFGDSFDDLVNICQKTAAQIKVLPRFGALLEDHNGIGNLRDLTIEDILEREPVCIDKKSCRDVLTDKTILVTGAGGSIGSELCRQLLYFAPRRLLALDNNETSLHDLHRELQESHNGNGYSEVCSIVADITDFSKIESVFRYYAPQIVFHAAAYKHVPVMEAHPEEAVRVNLMGTLILTDIADRFSAERFIYISTDKAVNPSCVMGASKRLGELWVATRQRGSATRFANVRFGNVVGSRGSVIPLFNRQIECGGPVTVTDPRMTRYFMSIPEAASLIIQAGAFAEGGEIYMLDMGRPIRIVDLAQKMIRLKGLRIGKDIQIKFIGIRPGEKLHEELSYATEDRRPTAHPKIYCLEDPFVPDPDDLLAEIAVLAAASRSTRSIVSRLGKGIILAARGDTDGFLEALADTPLSFHRRRLTDGKELVSDGSPSNRIREAGANVNQFQSVFLEGST